MYACQPQRQILAEKAGHFRSGGAFTFTASLHPLLFRSSLAAGINYGRAFDTSDVLRWCKCAWESWLCVRSRNAKSFPALSLQLSPDNAQLVPPLLLCLCKTQTEDEKELKKKSAPPLKSLILVLSHAHAQASNGKLTRLHVWKNTQLCIYLKANSICSWSEITGQAGYWIVAFGWIIEGNLPWIIHVWQFKVALTKNIILKYFYASIKLGLKFWHW
jgi:hypothetical protein